MPVCGIGPLVSIAALALSRRRPWLRSHAWQGLILGAAAAGAVIALWLVDFALESVGVPSPGVVAVVLQLAVYAAYLVLSLRTMADAQRRRDPALPWIGARARRWAGVRQAGTGDARSDGGRA